MRTAQLKFYAYIAFGICGVFFLFLAGSEPITDTSHFATNYLTALFLTVSGLGLCLFSLATLFLREEPDIWK